MEKIRYYLLAILVLVLFINTPELHPEVIEDATRALDYREEVTKTVNALYGSTIGAVQLTYKEIPVKVSVNGQEIDVPQLTLIKSSQAENTTVNANVDDMSLTAPNSLTAEQWDAIVAKYNPNIINTGKHAVAEGNRTHIDNAYVLAMWIKESTVGTAGAAVETKSSGNIVCAGYPTCIGRFRSYPSWEVGLTQHFDLMRCYREPGADGCDGLWVAGMKKHTTYPEVIDTWAPPSENNTNAYKDFVVGLVREWRKANQTIVQAQTNAEIKAESSLIPSGNPLNNKDTRITQGYGVGTHAPAETWGGIDLAISADGGEPIYATHDGTITTVANSWPGGNCALVVNEQYRTTYCHMRNFTVDSGVIVHRGQQIGVLGATGQVTGPHLHYEVWENGVNKNPEGFNLLQDLK